MPNIGYMRLFICSHCNQTRQTQNPNQMYCSKAPCQEAKRLRKNALKRSSEARLKKRRARANAVRD